MDSQKLIYSMKSQNAQNGWAVRKEEALRH
jgi:hypothetical protein